MHKLLTRLLIFGAKKLGHNSAAYHMEISLKWDKDDLDDQRQTNHLLRQAEEIIQLSLNNKQE